jgi:hypothetical protein
MASRWTLKRGLTGARPIHTAVGSGSRGPHSRGRLVYSRATCGKPHGGRLDQGGTGLFEARIAGTGELYLCKLGRRPGASRKQSFRLCLRRRRNASVQDNSCPRYLLRPALREMKPYPGRGRFAQVQAYTRQSQLRSCLGSRKTTHLSDAQISETSSRQMRRNGRTAARLERNFRAHSNIHHSYRDCWLFGKFRWCFVPSIPHFAAVRAMNMTR